MADCSYSRCVQERRNIRRELQKWTKNMVYIVGLERIAEELMGRRKWKLYQECVFRSQHQQVPINNNVLESKVKQEITENDEQERLKDWSPQSKCYLCVDGKLDSEHTIHGALSPHPSDSESSESPSDSDAPPTLTPSLHLLKRGRHGQGHGHGHGATGAMTSLVPPATAAAAGLPFYPQLFAGTPNWYLSSLARNLHQQQRDLDPDKVTPVAAEQPLDLSAKPGNSLNMPRLPVVDTKNIFNCDFRAKPRMSTVGGRRTYTEEELQAALRDIQSGKLGTRRAAVIYGIPRSTLRNKVYKLAMERERESHLAPLADEDVMDYERELSGAEEEKEVEKALQGPLVSMDDIVRFADSPEALRTLLRQQQLKSGNGKEEQWEALDHSALGPYIQLMMAQQLADKDPALMPMLPDFMRKVIGDEPHVNNGENETKTQLPPQSSPCNSIKTKTDSSDMDTEDSPANVILKIPSFKPTTSKNGGDTYRNDTGSLASPPVTSESGSPPIVTSSMLSLREAIAKSISQKFQQNPGPEPLIRHPTPIDIDYKRVGITPPLVGLSPAMKNPHHPPQPTPEPVTPPTVTPPSGLPSARSFQGTAYVVKNNATNSHSHTPANNNSTNSSSGSGGSTQGGKGTRPKRGKYRNYDRDSLVEAVRAVQRGEMSVHRAGSYYGVPHSTLEYKVKERHLMRPRKRDPKPNPVDEKIASLKNQEIRNIPDKMKSVIKPPQKYPPTSPNGIKMPAMFDPTMASLGYTPPPPFSFWPHPQFPHLPLEYPRNTPSSQFPTSPDFFASQMMQQLQERSGRCHGEGAGSGSGSGSATGTGSTTTTGTGTVSGAAAVGGANGTSGGLAKSAREMAESLYDGTGANGSFLDGIIRSSLDSGVPSITDKANSKEEKNVAPENMSNKALLDQLCRNSRITPLSKSTNVEANSSGDEASPLNFVNKQDVSVDKSRDRDRDDIQTIELCNDSNESTAAAPTGTSSKEEEAKESPTPPSRIYVKPQFQELTKPENLKPEVLVRFRSTGDECEPCAMPDSNGLSVVLDTGSASEKPDVAQD